MKKRMIIAGSAALLCTAALAEDVWVNRASLAIREGKGAAFSVVADAKKGDKLTVIAREDKWLKVSFSGKQGYVYEASLSARQVAPDGARLMTGDAEAGAMATDAAGKGLQPDSIHYAAARGMSSADLEAMLRARKSITGAEWVRFTRDGNVGPGHK